MTLTSDLLEDLTSMKDVWKSVSMRLGVPSVMAPGQPLMLMLSADSWDMVPLVILSIIMVIIVCYLSLSHFRCNCIS